MDTTPQRSSAAPDLFRARIAVSIAFFVMGCGPGIWAVHIPVVQQKLGLDPAILGLALFAFAVGAIVSMPVSGWVVGRLGSRAPTAMAMLIYVAVIPLPILAGTIPLLFAALFLFGVLLGGFDVLVNVQAAEVEAGRGKPTMSSFHAFYSIGSVAGAVVGAIVIANDLGDGRGAATAAVLLLGLAAMAAGNLYPSEKPVGNGPRFVMPGRAIIGLGVLAFLAYAIEGAVTDWSALFLTTVKEATPTTAASGFALFSLAMAGLRLFGDPIVMRVGSRRILVGGGLVAAIGLAIALLAPWPLVVAVGFGLVGIGTANIVPVLFSAAARTPGVAPGIGVAAIATVGYFGFLFAPPILGFIGNSFGLSASIATVLLMAAAMGLLGAIRR